MKRIHLIIIAGLLTVSIALPTLAHSNTAPTTTYDVSWYTIDSGGAMSISGGSYSLSGTIGQPDVGALSGGSYSLTGGFWTSDSNNNKTYVYLPLVIK